MTPLALRVAKSLAPKGIRRIWPVAAVVDIVAKDPKPVMLASIGAV